MRTIQVTLADDESVQLDPERVYMGEHCAARLAITLPARLCAGFDYYSLCFELMGCGNAIPTGNIYPLGNADENPMAYLDGNVIFCTLPEQLTACSYLRCQVDACKQEDGTCTVREKSAPFMLIFEHSVTGEAAPFFSFALGQLPSLQAQLDKMRETLQIDVLNWDQITGRPAFTPSEDSITAGKPLFLVEPGANDQSAQAATTQFVAQKTAQTLQLAQQTAQNTAHSVASALMQSLEDDVDIITRGMSATNHTIETNGGSVDVFAGGHNRIEIADGVENAQIVIRDDIDETNNFAAAFSFSVRMESETETQVEIVSAAENVIYFQTGFSFAPKQMHEVHVMDSMAATAVWSLE
ncbi:MAG: hypothetical protein LBB67_06360 [Oscillospiraceae bacterium]|jgi:hypothetical protein|nr:hypothetical protein [Oscillospiraceae bacterium]